MNPCGCNACHWKRRSPKGMTVGAYIWAHICRDTNYDYLKLCEFNASIENMVIHYYPHSLRTHKMPTQAIEIVRLNPCADVIFHIQNQMKPGGHFEYRSSVSSLSLSLPPTGSLKEAAKKHTFSSPSAQYRLNNSIIVGKLRTVRFDSNGCFWFAHSVPAHGPIALKTH